MKIKNIMGDELIKGSLILFVMINVFNFLNYIFHFSMARMLGPSDYGVLAVLMSVIYIFTIPSESIQTIVTKYTSKFNIKKEYGKIKDLLYRSMKKGFLFSLLIFIIFILISFFLSSFLKIKFYLFFLTGLFIFYVFFIPIMRGILQGRKKFTELGLNMIMESSIKVLLAITLVLTGLKVYGAMAAVLISGLITFIFVFFFLKEILSSKRKRGDFKGIYSYGLPVFVAIISVVLIYSLDIILAKRFFSGEIVGEYAAASMIGKMIFFGTYAIGKAMFPLTSETHEVGKETKKILGKSLKIVSVLSGIALVFYLFFPKLIIRILFGSAYVNGAGILFILGLAFTFLAFSNIIILYELSIGKRHFPFILLFFVILQVILLSIFNSNLVEFSFVILIVNFLMFVYNLFILLK